MMTPETANSLFLGIVSGIITTALLWLFSSYRKNTFIPWYEKRLYKGVNIQGVWKLVDDVHDIKDAEEPWGQYETLNLKQVAHRLTGSSDLVP